MKTEILMPSLSPTMEEGSLAKWYVSPGDKVKPGDIIADIETDKALMEYESIEEGTIVELIVKEGTENIKVNSLIAVLETEGAEEINIRKVDDIKKIEPVSIDNNEEVLSEEDKLDSVDSNVEDSKRLAKYAIRHHNLPKEGEAQKHKATDFSTIPVDENAPQKWQDHIGRRVSCV